MTDLKTQKSPKKKKKIWCLLENKKIENILSYFPKIFSQIFVEFGHKPLILHDLSKLKKILPIWKNWISRPRKTGVSFLVA